MLTPEIKAAAARAADWLEANPDKHIARSLACTATGRAVPPLSPDAECFCALGRLAFEADIEVHASYVPFDEVGVPYDDIFTANDADSGFPHDTGTYKIPAAHPEQGIAALRNLANA